jgi:hypothetical protein
MTEYQIILNVYLPTQGGRTVKKIVRGSDRDNMVTKFKYIGDLVMDKKKARELADWSQDNDIGGMITGTDGLFGVSYIKILP